MRQLLRIHPASRCTAVTQIEAEIIRPQADILSFSYVVTGNMNEIQFPPAGEIRRSDKLWQHTCLEAFVRTPSSEAYYEFNFAPSKQWAAYRFVSYRSGMNVVDEIGAPRIEVESASDHFILRASLALDRLSDLPRSAAWQLALSAVIEENSGQKSYWALAHPPGKPDFHHEDCFALTLSPMMPS